MSLSIAVIIPKGSLDSVSFSLAVKTRLLVMTGGLSL